jgi:hypothetical protein
MGLEPPLPSSTQRLVRCDSCNRLLYRINTERMCVAFVEDEERIKPLVVLVADRRLLFCSRGCMLTTLATIPIDEIASGWPVL